MAPGTQGEGNSPLITPLVVSCLVFVPLVISITLCGWCVKWIKKKFMKKTMGSYGLGKLAESPPKPFVHVFPQKQPDSPFLGRKNTSSVAKDEPDSAAAGLLGGPASGTSTPSTSRKADKSPKPSRSPLTLRSLSRSLLGANGSSSESEEETSTSLGQISFEVRYDFSDQVLAVQIFRAHNLPAKDFSGTSDPFVKVMLLPDKKNKLETKVKRKKLNPIWNEILLFEGIPYHKLTERILHLKVLDYDRFSRNDPIGEVNIPLGEVDLTAPLTYHKELTACRGAGTEFLGEILISLCYAPTAGRITIVVMKCRNLAAKDIIGKSDPYVKIWLNHRGKRVEKKKTQVKYQTLNPVFNEAFIFQIPVDKLVDTSFVVTVMDRDTLGRNESIGGIILTARSGPRESQHWNDMISKPRSPVAQWHTLKTA